MIEKLSRRSLHFFKQHGRRKRHLVNFGIERTYSARMQQDEQGFSVTHKSFRDVVRDKVSFVDKTLFIKEILHDRGACVTQITRPPGFGKTINLSMLASFLSNQIDENQTKDLFKDLKISEYALCMEHQGKYPVVSISFKDIRQNDFKSAYSMLYQRIIETYHQHPYLENSSKLTKYQKRSYEILMTKKANQAQLEDSLKFLTQCLSSHHGMDPWLLIDGYDTPMQAGYLGNYDKEIIHFMEGLLGAVLKTNPYLNRAVMTGILRIALYPALNNIVGYSVLDSSYSEHFGFSESEVDDILNQAHLSEKSTEIKRDCNRYKVDKTVIYNPGFITHCVKMGGYTSPYWVNASDHQLIKNLLQQSSLGFKIQFLRLMHGETIEIFTHVNIIFSDLKKDPDVGWSMLFMSGYLTSIASSETYQGIFSKVTIPNQEVHNLYCHIIEEWLSDSYGVEWYNQFILSLLSGKITEFKACVDKVFLKVSDYYDSSRVPEAFFYTLLLGFSASLQDDYEIKQNQENKLDSFDIMLIPRDKIKNESGIVIGLRFNNTSELLTETANNSLFQVEKKIYTEAFKQHDIEKIIHIGIEFKGKECVIDRILIGYDETPKNSFF